MLEIIEEAGWPIWLIMASSIVSLAIILERFYSLKRSSTYPSGLTKHYVKAIESGEEESLLQDSSSSLARILNSAVSSKAKDKEALKDSLENSARKEIISLERFLTTLGSIAAMAPLLGLLGTVIGMIEIFASQSPTGADPRMLARGISVALYNTAFGLLVAIPSMMFYRHFRSKVENILSDMEVASNRIWHLLCDHRHLK